jgi:hypothetical protein
VSVLSALSERVLTACLAATGPPQEGLAEPDLLLDFSAPLPPWIPMILGALLILFVLARALFGRERPEIAPPVVSPHEEALQALASLEASVPRAELEEDPFHVGLSRVLRRYLAGRFGLAALEMASEEALAAIDAGEIGARQRGILEGVLGQCDRVKFGRRFAGPDAAREILGQARLFVKETAEPPPGEGGGA